MPIEWPPNYYLKTYVIELNNKAILVIVWSKCRTTKSPHLSL